MANNINFIQDEPLPSGTGRSGDPGLNINFQGIIQKDGKDTDQCSSFTDQYSGKYTGCVAAIAGPGGENNGPFANLGCPSKGTEKGHVLAPWVLIEFGTQNDNGTFGGGGNKITVSNLSSPTTEPKNTAVIQSFEFGQSDGIIVNVTIQDTEGGSFVDFVENLFSDWNCLHGGTDGGIPNPTMKFQFGWVKSGCLTPMPTSHSECYYCIIDGIDTSFSEGKFIAELTGTDITRTMMQGHTDEVKGDDGENKMCLADAVRELLTNDVSPNIGSVAFRRWEGGKLVPAGFEHKEADCALGKNPPQGADKKDFAANKGPKRKWTPSSQDKLRSAMRWLEGWSSDGNPPKGWMPMYNANAPKGEMVFIEDQRPDCEAKPDLYFDQDCVGVYIVNGSKESSVLEFNPKIHWDFSRLVSGGGGMGNQAAKGQKTKGSKSHGRRDCPGLTRAALQGAGHPLQTPSTEVHQAIFGKDQEDEKQKADVLQLKAFKVLHDDVTAELVIVGDPTFTPIKTRHKYLTIAFINPYFLQVGRGCTDWTSRPPCNEVLTSKAWQILQIFHKIELGKYTTHITVFLPPGGTDGSPGEPLGLWVNGWRPKLCTPAPQGA